MRIATGTVILLLLISPLFAQDPKCATCAGKGELVCFGCDGKGSFDAPCVLCLMRSSIAHDNCKGTGKIACGKCEGSDLPGHRANAQNCRVCRGKRAIVCRVCVKGQMGCGACAGKKKVSRSCPVCSGAKKLACPDCRPASTDAACGACKGEKTEACPICLGTIKVPTACLACQGSGVQACSACQGLGIILCPNCDLLGHERTCVCTKCNGKGFKPDATCRGKGTSDCPTCAGKGGEGICWACQGAGRLACRRCGVVKSWSAKDEASGVRVTVFPVDPFEPYVHPGLRVAFVGTKPVLWRVILDARETRKPFAIGGWGGWELVGTEPNDKTATLGPCALPKESQERFTRFLEFCALGKEASKHPIAASQLRVVTTPPGRRETPTCR